MKRTIITVCSLMALAALASSCGLNHRKSLASVQPAKGQKWDVYKHITPASKGTTHCMINCQTAGKGRDEYLFRTGHRAYGKAVGYKASSLTIKDYMK